MSCMDAVRPEERGEGKALAYLLNKKTTGRDYVKAVKISKFKGSIAGKYTWLGIVYLWAVNGAGKENEEMVNSMRSNTNEFKGSGE